jgi:hypothetical protein
LHKFSAIGYLGFLKIFLCCGCRLLDACLSNSLTAQRRVDSSFFYERGTKHGKEEEKIDFSIKQQFFLLSNKSQPERLLKIAISPLLFNIGSEFDDCKCRG